MRFRARRPEPYSVRRVQGPIGGVTLDRGTVPLNAGPAANVRSPLYHSRMTQADVDSLFTTGDSFCALPWLQVLASVDGIYARCCTDNSQFTRHFEGATKPVLRLPAESLGCAEGSPYAADNPDRVETLRSAFNSPAMRETRVAMLAGERVAACEDCYHRQAKTGHSMRTSVNGYYASRFAWVEMLRKTAPDGRVALDPIDLDLRLGNACNLRCQMCSFPVSSAWRPDAVSWHRSAVIDPYAKDERFWADIHALAPKLQHIFLAGGEPFLQAGHLPLLRRLIEAGAAHHIHLVYTSNLTVLAPEAFALWKEFQEVTVTASCDGVGEVFEKIRCGARWDVFAANVAVVQQHATTMKLATTVQQDNLPFLAALFAWSHAIAIPLDLSNILTHPEAMSILQMERATVERCYDEYRNLAPHYAELGNAPLADEITRFCQTLATVLQDPAPVA